MITSALLVASIAVLPSDRMAMGDRQFDRGDYSSAAVEYRAIKGVKSNIPQDEILYRLAECDRLMGNISKANDTYAELLKTYPLSRHANRVRLMRALSIEGAEKISELKILDSNGVPVDIRTCALYNLGTALNDMEILTRCVELDPKGPYSRYAQFHIASLMLKSTDFAVRRRGIAKLYSIYLTGDEKLACDALYFAGVRAYADKSYDEASKLLRIFLSAYPNDSKISQVRSYTAWSDFLSKRYAEAAALSASADTDDLAYLFAASTYAMSDFNKAVGLMESYLQKYSSGKYCDVVELTLSRLKYDDAEKTKNYSAMVSFGKKAADLSKTGRDRLRLAWAYECIGNIANAKEEYENLSRDFPSTDEAAEALFRKAMIDIRDSKWSPAELALAELLATGKGINHRAEAFYWRGICAVRLGHEQKGVGFLKEALKLGISLDTTREANLIIADEDYKAGNIVQAKNAYAQLVREGACKRMSAAKIMSVGRFLLESPEGEVAFDAAKLCAKALVDLVGVDNHEWRQAGFALQGEAEEAAGEFLLAIASYRQAMAEPVVTVDKKKVALKLGILLHKSGNLAEANEVLKEAVKLNHSSIRERATAYLYLAKNNLADGNEKAAYNYATVIVTLFDVPDVVDEAKKLLSSLTQEVK